MTADILLIESSEETVGALRTALTPFDVALRVVADGTRGIIEAEKQKPTAILLGLELPPKNYGYVVCQRLKKSDVTSTVPLVLLYASATETDIERHRTLRHRADAYLRKPFAGAQVVGALDQLLGALPRRDEPPVEVTLHDDDILFDENPPFEAPVEDAAEPMPPSRETATLKAEVDRLTRAAETLRDELETARVQAGSDLDELKARVAELEREVASRDASIVTLRAEAERSQPEFDKVRSALDAAQTRLAEAEVKLDRALQVRERMRRAVDILKTLTMD